MKIILADIGGTHARFSFLNEGKPENSQKFKVVDFESLETALESYSGEKAKLYIATAAWPYADGLWRFPRPNHPWIISEEALGNAGWELSHIGNDFGAGARGALSLPPEELYNIQSKGQNDIAQNRTAVLGSGTGLGLAYVDGDGRIQETYGGHMDVPYRTDEQRTIVELIGRIKENDRPVSAEDIVSGPGVILLYKAACMVHGSAPEDLGCGMILGRKGEGLFDYTLRLYHEFLGMFAHQTVIYGHSYAGLYLDSGVLHSLAKADDFNKEHFLEFFVGDPLPLIKKQIEAMKVNIVMDPFVAFRGLAEIAKNEA